MLFRNLASTILCYLYNQYCSVINSQCESIVYIYRYIIYEIWAGDAKSAADTTSEGTQFAFKAMAIILTAGWAIYPIGYFLGTGDDPDVDGLNILYNLADAVNKVAFGLMVWYAATMDSE